MTETPNLGLPLVQPAQAQKHVTVNEALIRLDALSQIALQSITVAAPPAPIDGLAYGVPTGASGPWAGHAGEVAVASGGGWIFVSPRIGWRAQVVDAGNLVEHNGSGWFPVALSRSPSGAGVRLETIEFDHVLGAGTTSTTIEEIPAGMMVLSCGARVQTTITGSVSFWALGVPGFPEQFGSGLGLVSGSYATGILGTPTTYYGAEPLVLTAESGAFAGGTVRLAIHGLRFDLPN